MMVLKLMILSKIKALVFVCVCVGVHVIIIEVATMMQYTCVVVLCKTNEK